MKETADTPFHISNNSECVCVCVSVRWRLTSLYTRKLTTSHRENLFKDKEERSRGWTRACVCLCVSVCVCVGGSNVLAHQSRTVFHYSQYKTRSTLLMQQLCVCVCVCVCVRAWVHTVHTVLCVYIIAFVQKCLYISPLLLQQSMCVPDYIINFHRFFHFI